MTEDKAIALVKEYPTLGALMEAYEQCDTEQDRELLLENIKVQDLIGDPFKTKTVGKGISKKVYIFLNGGESDLIS
jgi:hypothetical protein